ncbi:MAG: hypothetical protein RLZZ306_2652 [Bacteroidota bacterium]|jgi:hypothetical protein
MKKVILYLFLSVFTFNISAQGLDKTYKTFDLVIGTGKTGFSPALSFTQSWGLGKSNRFKVGYVVRVTPYFGGETDFRTAPARFTSGTSSFSALFADDIIANIDTFRVKSFQTFAVNIGVIIQYAISNKLEVGFNIDATGKTWGTTVTGDLISRTNKRKFQDGSTTSAANPETWNFLLISDSDIGSLNSEIYARYWVTNKIGIRAGASFQFVELTTEKKVEINGRLNDTWRSKSLMPIVAVSYKF